MDQPRLRARLERAIPALLAVAVVLVVGFGGWSILHAQRGELAHDPNWKPVLGAPEAVRETVHVHECRDAKGRTLYAADGCAAGESVARELDATSVSLAPAAPGPSAAARAPAASASSAGSTANTGR